MGRRSTPGCKNALLSALNAADLRRLHGSLEPVFMTYGDVLCEPGARFRHVYFPNEGIISQLAVDHQDKVLEVAMVGNEGVFGTPLALGAHTSSVRALVQGQGSALRMTASQFLKALAGSPVLQRHILRYAHSQMVQVTQNAACNRFHPVEARLARWLLMTHDRMRNRVFHVTQEFLASMVGIRRTGITEAAGMLRRHKLISYQRGEITILDRKGLAATACPCYRVIRRDEQSR